MSAATKAVLASRISYLIDDLICDPSTNDRQRAELLRVRRRFAILIDGDRGQEPHRPARTNRSN